MPVPVHLNGHKGWIKVTQVKEKMPLLLEFTHDLSRFCRALEQGTRTCSIERAPSRYQSSHTEAVRKLQG